MVQVIPRSVNCVLLGLGLTTALGIRGTAFGMAGLMAKERTKGKGLDAGLV